MKTKILILGASGRLGSHIFEYYLNKNINFEVIAFNRNNKNNIDITDKSTINNFLNNIKPEIIVNAIALADVQSCEENPLLALKLNSELLSNIVDWMEDNKNTYMIHISTDHVYDNKHLSTENDINIKNMYAYSKYIGDQFAIKSNTTILRTNFFGIFNNKDSLCNWVINSIKNNKKIYCYDDIFFSPVHINTLVDFVNFFVENKILGIYNIGSLEGFSKHNFILEMIKTLGLKTSLLIKCSYSSENNQINRPKNMMMNLNKISKIYNKDLPILKYEINKLKSL